MKGFDKIVARRIISEPTKEMMEREILNESLKERISLVMVLLPKKINIRK